MPLGIVGEPQPAVPEHHVLVGNRHEDAAVSHSRQRLAVLRVADAQRRLAVEPLREACRKGRCDVNHEQDGEGVVGRHRFQDLDQGGGAARRSADGEGPAGGGCLRARRRPAQPAQSAPGMRDHLDARHELDGGDERPGPPVVQLDPGRLLEHVDRAGGQSLVGPEQLASIGRGGDDQDRRGAVRHDELGGGEARHDREHHVEGDHVRPELLAELDRLLAVLGLSDHVELGIAGEHLDEALANGERVLDHQDADGRHGYPASSRMHSRS